MATHRIGLDALGDVDWSRVYHAYGRARDTPDHLRGLVSGDVKTVTAALNHLWSALIHQGTPWTATAPAALVVAGLVHPSVAAAYQQPSSNEPPVRVSLMRFLQAVAEACRVGADDLAEMERAAAAKDLDALLDADDDEAMYGDEGTMNAFYAHTLLACRAAAPVLMDVALERMNDRDPRMRTGAAATATELARSVVPDKAPALIDRLTTMVHAGTQPDERAALALSIGDVGGAPESLLSDASPAVRLCAALAPALAGNETATLELLDALERHAGEIDGWFKERPPQFDACVRFSVVAALVARVKSFDRLAGAAVAVASVTGKYSVDSEWGPLLVAAFADGTGQVRTAAQRQYLSALVANGELWDKRFGNAGRWFRQAGLPYDRESCRKLAD